VTQKFDPQAVSSPSFAAMVPLGKLLVVARGVSGVPLTFTVGIVVEAGVVAAGAVLGRSSVKDTFGDGDSSEDDS
jgi:hypothetical protein